MARTRTRRLSEGARLKEAGQRVRSVGESFEHLRLLIYGQNGKGKTRLAASGPRPLLLVDCNEKGTLSVRNYADVDVFEVREWADIDLAYWYIHQNEKKYATVVLDTTTSLASLCMKFVLGDEQSRDPTKDPEMPGRREWGKVAELMKTQILQFRNLPLHVVFIAQERRGFTDDDDESDTPDVFPDVSPSIRQTLTAAVDVIGRMHVKEVKSDEGGKRKRAGVQYRMLIGPSERYLTKDRSEAGLPNIIPLKDDDRNLDKLVNRIKRGAKIGNDQGEG